MEDLLYATPKLLALLDKMVKPIDKCTINLEVQGVFGLPEDWKTTDDLNPNLFSYKTNFQGITVTEGKIVARELTDQEKKELEEAQIKKKPPPKDKKAATEIIQISPEEQERLRLLEEERIEAERKAQEEWDALTDQERFYRTYEDKYKKDSLKFANNTGAIEKESEDLIIFEEDVQLGGAWLYFTKFPTATEEEMVKMRKGKPKNLNLLDLNPCNMRAWVDLTEFQNPGISTLTYRAKIERFYNPEEKPEELPNPNLENTYILIKIDLDPPITQLIVDAQPKIGDIIPQPIPIQKLPPAVEVVNDFKSQLVMIVESLAMEYSTMFGKEMNHAQDPKPKLQLSAQQKRDIKDQRKEKFLYDFNTTGKYNILREKMKKCIMKIVRDRFQKTGSLTGVTADSKDQFYSELYAFLNDQMRQTLNDLVFEKKDELNDELVVSAKQADKEREAVITNITKESESEKQLRLAVENEIINNLAESENGFKNLFAADRKNHKNSYMYCQFLIRRKNFPKAEEMLLEALRYDNHNPTYINLLAVLHARRGKRKEALVALNSLLDRDPFDSLVNTLISFVYNKLMSEPKLGDKYLAISQRILLRKQNLLPQKEGPTNPTEEAEEVPAQRASIQPAQSTVRKIEVTNDQNDELWIEVVDYLVKNGIFDLAEQAIEEIKNKTIPTVDFFRAQIAFMKGEFKNWMETLNNLIKAYPKNSEYLLTKANYCFEKDRFNEAEPTFMQAFKLRTTVKTFPSFLRLGYTYLYRRAWGDARAVLTKACELKSSSSLAWLGLGIACFRSEEYHEGELALSQANIYDPLNAEIWGYLALLCLHDGERHVQAHQALREMLKCELKNGGLVEELADRLVDTGKLEEAETLYRRLVDNWQGANLGNMDRIGNIHTKLANVYYTQERLENAKLYYTEALRYLEDENEREKVGMILIDIKHGLDTIHQSGM